MMMEQFSIGSQRLSQLLDEMKDVTVGLIGDVCLDVYWMADMKKSELSRETPHFPLPVVSERFSLGAAGNVATNMSDLGLCDVKLVSIAGNDWRYALLEDLLLKNNISVDGLVKCSDMITPAYCKPMRMGISNVVYEDPRLDFANYQHPSKEDEDKIIEKLDEMVNTVDVLAVSDQFEFGCITKRVRERICEIGKTKTVIVDSRNNIGKYKNVIIKPNEVEAGVLLGESIVIKDDWNSLLCSVGEKLNKLTGKSVVVTLGENGSFYHGEGKNVFVPALKISPPIDFVGAGDTFLSAFASSLAAGASGAEALAVGNLASSVIIKKIGITGTATPEEILRNHRNNRGE